MGTSCINTNFNTINKLNLQHLSPRQAVITSICKMTEQEKLFTINFASNKSSTNKHFEYKPSQFVMLSVFGYGEAPISICSGPQDKDIKLCIRKVGTLTKRIHSMEVGENIGIRGPYGNGFPTEKLEGKDILLIAGGLGLAPLRSLVRYILHNREKYKDFTILYGTKKQSDRLFTEDIEEWKQDKRINFYETVDIGDASWEGEIGLVTELFKYINPSPKNTVAFIIGPQIMYRFVLHELLDRNIETSSIYMDFERRMKCGIQKCGHCQINGLFACNDGPVFNYANMISKQLKEAL